MLLWLHGATLLALQTLSLFLTNKTSQPHQVGRNNGNAHHPREPISTKRVNPLHTVMLCTYSSLIQSPHADSERRQTHKP
ncbi:MAG: hypothetical protein OXC62_05565, partial [Aestuariivita sp.]|nr:hypothetical protein [Aestuariivita sp.]